jgi:hypothetical protein
MGIIALIGNAFAAVKSYFGWAKQRDGESNSPDMKQAKEAKTEAAAVDQTRTALAKKDLDELRREAAE